MISFNIECVPLGKQINIQGEGRSDGFLCCSKASRDFNPLVEGFAGVVYRPT